MDPLAAHRARVGHLRESFAEANERLVARLRNSDDDAARHVPASGGWSGAQVGWHVAKVTTRFAGLMSGELPGAQPLAAGFVERPWSEIAAQVADRLEAPASVQPPPGVSRMEAIAALEASGMKMAHALDTVTRRARRRSGHHEPDRRRGDQPLSGRRVGNRPRHQAQQADEAGAWEVGRNLASVLHDSESSRMNAVAVGDGFTRHHGCCRTTS